jgi:hypothetical protein
VYTLALVSSVGQLELARVCSEAITAGSRSSFTWGWILPIYEGSNDWGLVLFLKYWKNNPGIFFHGTGLLLAQAVKYYNNFVILQFLKNFVAKLILSDQLFDHLKRSYYYLSDMCNSSLIVKAVCGSQNTLDQAGMLNTRLQGDDPTPVAGVTKPA